jgi:hypothetical protein|tara:strand:+ start:425 stop:778 length:354 start_codon:yes stop_codon:yes gene_type:complete
MKLIFIFFFSVLLFSQIGADEFVEGLGDIPNFKNMQNVEDSFILFDKVEGRYLYSEVEGDYDKKEINDFYKNVLPNLGWKILNNNQFERGNEILDIKYERIDDLTKVLFSIAPKKIK